MRTIKSFDQITHVQVLRHPVEFMNLLNQGCYLVQMNEDEWLYAYGYFLGLMNENEFESMSLMKLNEGYGKF